MTKALYLVLQVASAMLIVSCSLPQFDTKVGGPNSNDLARSAIVDTRKQTNGALIYATGGCGGMCVLSYPQGSIIARVSINGGIPCSDNAGNVFVPGSGKVFEYGHGGTSPIATFSLPESSADGNSCSVDPTTNSLAVTYVSKKCGCVAVFADESGVPTEYSTGIGSGSCAYDDAGNLFVDGATSTRPAISELTVGGGSFIPLTIHGRLVGQPGQLQWDGTNLTYEGRAYDGRHATISQLGVSGSVVTVVSSTHLHGKIDRTAFSWIYDGAVLVPYASMGIRFDKIGVWSYPAGGSPESILKFANAKTWTFRGVTISVVQTK